MNEVRVYTETGYHWHRADSERPGLTLCGWPVCLDPRPNHVALVVSLCANCEGWERTRVPR